MVRDAAGWWTREQNQTADHLKRAIDTTASGARSLVGGLFDGLEALSHALPGGGVLRVFGSLGAALASAGVGGTAELVKALVRLGIPQSEARYYGDAFARGAMLVTVQAKTDKIAQCALGLMLEFGALAPNDRVTP